MQNIFEHTLIVHNTGKTDHDPYLFETKREIKQPVLRIHTVAHWLGNQNITKLS